MKLNAWLITFLTPLVALTVVAQTPPAPPPAVPPPPAVTATEPAPTPVAPTATTNAAAKPAKKAKAKAKAKHKESAAKETAKKAEAKPSGVIVLNPPVTATVKADVLDVRGQGSFVGEVIGHVKKGDTVTVVEEITHVHAQSGEPKQWSKIVMPTNIHVWLSGQFVDSNKTVRVKKINLRGGPGENYSVVGSLEKGASVDEIKRKAGWVEIAPPTNAFAFVASEYLEAGGPAPEVATAPPPTPVPQPPPAAPTIVNVQPEAAPAPAPAPPPSTGIAAPAPTASSQADQELAALRHATPAEPAASAPAPAPAAPPDTEQSPRIVTREGYVHRSYNIQAPEGYELHDIKTGDLTEYLQPGRLQKFHTYLGSRVRVTGPEYLDPRWPRTPVLHIETVELMP